MASRPKRRCKDEANAALGYIDDDTDDGMDLLSDDSGDDGHQPGSPLPSDSDDVVMEENLVDLSAESSTSSDDDTQAELSVQQHTASSGRIWSFNIPVAQGRAPARNVIRFQKGCKAGVNPTMERESVIIFLDNIIDEILIYSNLQGRRVVQKWNLDHLANRKKWRPIDRQELEAFIGLLYVLGAFRSKYRDIEELWSTRDGFCVCRATMSMERFLQIKRCLRFDDPLRRNRADRLSPIRVIHDQFNLKLREFYVPSEVLTIDEQLLEFHGRVQFQQYIGTKPGKFGIKLIWLCDAENFYALNSVIYIGVGTIEPEVGLTAKSVTMHLMKPYLDTGRHLTSDNWFSSVNLTDLRTHMTSYIGTLRKNNRDVSSIVKNTTDRTRKDTKVFYDNTGSILVSFWDKGTSPVLLIDTFHRTVPQPDIETKPCTVLEYNRCKSGVDMADKRIRGLSCKRKCRRWPFAIFSNMLDIAGSNGCIIYNLKHPGGDRKEEQHYCFLKNAGYQMVDAVIKRRLAVGSFNTKIKFAMEAIGYETANPAQDAPVKFEKSKRCAYCNRGKDRKTFYACPKCKLPRCVEHQSALCTNCYH